MPESRKALTLPAIRGLELPQGRPKARREVADVQRVLGHLGLEVAPEEVRAGKFGSSTKEAVAQLQARAGLRTTGTITPETADFVKRELEHRFFATSKTRVGRIQEMLREAGAELDPEEVSARVLGETSAAALRELAGAEPATDRDGAPWIDESVVDRARAAALEAKLRSKNQSGRAQRAVLRAARIAGLDVTIDEAELRSRELGPSTTAAVEALQRKYGLEATGAIDPATWDRVASLNASRPAPMKALKVKRADDLQPIPKALRLNMTGGEVAKAQTALAFLGHQIAASEHGEQRFGKTTRQAIVAFQASRGLAQTGHLEQATLHALNAEIAAAAPAAATEHPYRIRGSVRDETWRGMAGVKVRIHDRPVRGEGALLAERPTLANGFFDLPYDPPRDPATKQVRTPVHLEVSFASGEQELGRRVLFNPTRIAWVNLTLGDRPYRGDSTFQVQMAALERVLRGARVDELVETADDHQVTRAALEAGLMQDDVMRLVLAHEVAAELADPAITPAACFAYLGQELPPNLPADLLAATQEWTAIGSLVDQAAVGIVFMDAVQRTAAFDAAVDANLIPIDVALQKDAVLQALEGRRAALALDKPILVGDGTLRGVLEASDVAAAAYPDVADAFVRHEGPTGAFWTELAGRAGDLGGEAAVADLRTTIDVAQIAENRSPLMTQIKSVIADPGIEDVSTSRDLAKLTVDRWEAIVADAGGAPGGAAAYAATLAARTEELFPEVAFAAEVVRSTGHGLTKATEAAAFIDAQPDFALRTDNVDAFVTERAPDLDPAVVGELRVMQRAHRLGPTAVAGRALLEAGVHSSMQVMSLGLDGLERKLGVVDPGIRRAIYAHAELQYGQVLQQLGELRRELHRANPRAVGERAVTVEEAREVLGELPDLEVLFGSMDLCDCEGCMSVHSPAAYLADVLRFLSNRPAVQAGRTVLDVLLARRPDIADIKLNCPNTETPLPYIDLVCERLEAAVPAPTAPPTMLQSTRSAAELRALPEHLRPEAYETLRGARFPIDGGFDLWQEEARVLLEHLSVPRHELMAAFAPDDAASRTATGAEFLGISSNALRLIVTGAPTAAAQDELWGFDTTRASISVAEFLGHARLTFPQLEELLRVRWLRGDGVAPLALERPGGTCDLDEMRLTGLSVAAFDRVHRLLRLWRHTRWSLTELDLLLRAPGVGAGALDGAAIVALHRFALVAQRLKLAFPQALTLYRTIDTDPPQPEARSQYELLFQNRLVTNPVDPAFALPLAGGEQMAAHTATLAAAYQVTEAELALLLPRTGATVTLENLTTPLRHVTLARRLGIPVGEALGLLDLCQAQTPDAFASPQATLDVLDVHDEIRAAGFTVDELRYLLEHRPESPLDLREETITEQVVALREALRTTPAADKAGQVAAHVASTFGLTDQQAVILLDQLRPGAAVLAHLSDAALTAQTGETFTHEVTPARFPDIYADWRLLHKASLLVRRLRIGADVLRWLLERASTFGWLHLGALPVAGPSATPLFEGWRALAGWVLLRRAHPEPEGSTLAGLFDLVHGGATAQAARDAAEALMGWAATDLAALDGGDPAVYVRVPALRRMDQRMRITRRLGIDVATARDWADRESETDGRQRRIAREVNQIVKSKYDHDVWLATITPLQDRLRERRRDALLGYLLEHSTRNVPRTITHAGREYANPQHWREVDDVLRYFLLDVEMSSCQLTSRIKQAISSVQMFVQRCQLNLERPFVAISADEQADTTSLDSWRQWRWMKNYRVWEANRKVFLYPENWIEPELRDDKSPFFEELEQDILQKEITDENCETAFGRYLAKVHEVSRLKVLGVYHEVDEEASALAPRVNRLHVVARTPTEPARYYYRAFDLAYATWTPWERIEVDVVGDHVIPVVYNRRLHLFWLVMTEKPQKVRKQPPAKASNAPSDVPEPPGLLEIQLAWSVRTKEGFGPRAVSPYKLVHPWQRPVSSYNLKPRYKPNENHLWLDLYISTTREFNDALFYDPYSNERRRLTDTRFSESLRPWHSSSFVFDGTVVALKLKPLVGQYHVLEPSTGYVSESLIDTDSFTYVRDTATTDRRALSPLTGGYEIAPRLKLPEGMHFEHARLANNRAPRNGGNLNVLEGDTTVNLLTRAHDPFELATTSHTIQFDARAEPLSPMLYQDSARAYFIRPEWRSLVFGGFIETVSWLRYRWLPFTHPYTALFIRELNRSGIDGLLNRRIQRFPGSYRGASAGGAFEAAYGPSGRSVVDDTAERDIVDFSHEGAYSIYNWEIFFHAPLLIATKLMANQRFEEAMQWFHRIFDPTNTDAVSTPQRYWITKPFFDQTSDDYRRQRIEQLLRDITGNLDQVRAWRNNPFNPHLIARYRPVAFQRAVVMRYIDNLIAWGDQLFRRDTLESINEASLLYVLAAELLGPLPAKVPAVKHAEKSYNQLVADGALDPFGNKRVDVLMENYVAPPARAISPNGAEPLPQLDVLYFGIPANDRLLGYWSTVGDRLFNIRHCRNIEGVFRQLPLFEPPIDPALLVKAAAAGVDISSVLGATAAPPSLYRFPYLTDRASQLCAEVRALGDKLLRVLEQRDAEGLAMLNAGQELSLARAIKGVREEQVDEALKTQAALEKGIDVVDKRIEYYGDIPRMNGWEVASAISHGAGIVSEIVATVLQSVSGAAAVVPQIKAGASGFGGSPTLTVEMGGEQVAKSSFNFAAMFAGLAGILHHSGDMLSAQGSYTRQDDANRFNVALAEREKDQLEVQIEAAAIRHRIAELELESHEVSIANAESVAEYLRTKYTNAQLYDWMLGQVATLYFQAYQIAFDMARRAERSFQLEVGDASASFIQFGYWDSLKKGLLAGERLSNDLRRMEAAYVDRHEREFELTKHVSLAEVAPLSLLALKLNGTTTVELPEWLFDLDYPGHYRRRIKSVALSIPGVVGPYAGVNCTLSLTNNGVRLTDAVPGGFGDPLNPGADTRFARNAVPVSAIATSHAASDRGLFELRFTDERYLPFEYAGAVSQWTLDLPKQANRFDLSSIADVIMHVDYTAVAGGPALVAAAQANLDAVLPTKGAQLLVLDEQFATAWHRMLHPPEGADQVLRLELGLEHLPFWARARAARTGSTPSVAKVDLVLDTPSPAAYEGRLALPGPSGAPGTAATVAGPVDTSFGGMPHLAATPAPGTRFAGRWELSLRKGDVPGFRDLAPEDVRGAYLVVQFTV
ncbi:MAG TPA: neuraminidase-like domain-containing protein [Solirubrobacteraceae bacterium]|nr:neuraminidase-like domain-containing protein [Solirubrobacteraceae bacterium]